MNLFVYRQMVQSLGFQKHRNLGNFQNRNFYHLETRKHCDIPLRSQFLMIALKVLAGYASVKSVGWFSSHLMIDFHLCLTH